MLSTLVDAISAGRLSPQPIFCVSCEWGDGFVRRLPRPRDALVVPIYIVLVSSPERNETLSCPSSAEAAQFPCCSYVQHEAEDSGAGQSK